MSDECKEIYNRWSEMKYMIISSTPNQIDLNMEFMRNEWIIFEKLQALECDKMQGFPIGEGENDARTVDWSKKSMLIEIVCVGNEAFVWV